MRKVSKLSDLSKFSGRKITDAKGADVRVVSPKAEAPPKVAPAVAVDPRVTALTESFVKHQVATQAALERLQSPVMVLPPKVVIPQRVVPGWTLHFEKDRAGRLAGGTIAPKGGGKAWTFSVSRDRAGFINDLELK